MEKLASVGPLPKRFVPLGFSASGRPPGSGEDAARPPGVPRPPAPSPCPLLNDFTHSTDSRSPRCRCCSRHSIRIFSVDLRTAFIRSPFSRYAMKRAVFHCKTLAARLPLFSALHPGSQSGKLASLPPGPQLGTFSFFFLLCALTCF